MNNILILLYGVNYNRRGIAIRFLKNKDMIRIRVRFMVTVKSIHALMNK